MRPVKTIFQLVLLLWCSFLAAADAAAACEAIREAREVTSEAIAAFAERRKMDVLTFAGYSGAQYEDPAAMLVF